MSTDQREITVEMVGLARHLAGTDSVRVRVPSEGGCLGDLVRGLAEAVPELRGTVLHSDPPVLLGSHQLSADGCAWSHDPAAPLGSVGRWLLFSAAAGG